ncbi:hypothetical protein [Salipiger thiooxidans]|uniref:hypothetical protein n=1 Tax=Salipiger thiooxidans TaxID=282683 RepID=UPI001CD59736|nr:hypothetical protein [Salipiger thiooxidans]MCA0851433.1 hypothetical protein [Salipiger thiooxidans]
MKSAAFNKMIANELKVPLNVVTDVTRRLKEAGLLSTAPRGAPAPDMTPLDAARVILAFLTTDRPVECVERVRRFGQIKYSPSFRKSIRGYVTIQPDEFAEIFEGETFEEVLAYLFSLPERLGIERACQWSDQHIFHVRVEPFPVLGELFSPIREDGEITGERVVPFKGKVWADLAEGEKMPRPVEGWTIIKGGIRVQREIIGMTFLMIGIALMPEDDTEGAQ